MPGWNGATRGDAGTRRRPPFFVGVSVLRCPEAPGPTVTPGGTCRLLAFICSGSTSSHPRRSRAEGPSSPSHLLTTCTWKQGPLGVPLYVSKRGAFGNPRKLQDEAARWAGSRVSQEGLGASNRQGRADAPGGLGQQVRSPIAAAGGALTRFSWPGAPWAWSPARRSP